MHRPIRFAAAVAVALVPVLAVAASAAPAPEAYHVIRHGYPLRAGEHAIIRIVPEPPPGVLEAIMVTTVEGRTLSLVGPYRAPYVIELGTPPIEVTAVLTGEGWRREAKTTIDLVPSSVLGAEDCLGPGQAFVPEYGDIAGTAGELSDMPVLSYPVTASLPGVTGTIIVRALVCRSGRVIDAVVPGSVADTRVRTNVRDPRAVQAAENAVRKALFGRGRAAAWMEIPVRFGS